ncbi:MAG: hypothetical protein VX938_05610, partial [Myxococcota bacterium]|nr:hypothetical protein [Myxococcota bacterium]
MRRRIRRFLWLSAVCLTWTAACDTGSDSSGVTDEEDVSAAGPAIGGGVGDAGTGVALDVASAPADDVATSGPPVTGMVAAAPNPYSGGTCPQLSAGLQTFQAAGTAREVDLKLPAEPSGAPVVFMWHGLGDTIANFSNAMGAGGLTTGLGAIVVTPAVLPGGLMALWGFPSALGDDSATDLGLFDDLLYCLDQQFDIDNERVYSVGFSGGALWTSYLLMQRSEYLAAALVFSGGVNAAGGQGLIFDYETPLHPLPVMLAHGGATDVYNMVVAQLEFQKMVELMADSLVADGHFAVLCDHGAGHTITSPLLTAGYSFLQNHAYAD